MSKKNRATDRAARAAAALQEQKRQEARRRNTVIGGVVAVILVLVVGGFFLSKALDTTTDVDAPSAGSEFGLTVGPEDATHEIVVYEDFFCVHCATFEENTATELTELAAEGTVRVEYRPIAILGDYSLRSANAFKVVLDESGSDVAKDFHDLVFEHYREAARNGDGLSDDKLIELAGEAGADEDAVRSAIEGVEQRSWVEDATQAAQDAGVTGTPTVLLDGEVYQNGRTTEEIAENLLADLE